MRKLGTFTRDEILSPKRAGHIFVGDKLIAQGCGARIGDSVVVYSTMAGRSYFAALLEHGVPRTSFGCEHFLEASGIVRRYLGDRSVVVVEVEQTTYDAITDAIDQAMLAIADAGLSGI